MFLKKQVVFLLVLFAMGQVGAQDYDSFFFGTLVDATTGEPVVFGTVRVKGQALGVISNNDGGFKIPMAFQFKGNALVISSMGYETKEVDFSTMERNGINRILLKPAVFELSETTVTARKKRRRLEKVKGELSAEQIIRYAINNIPYNYDNNPFQLVGYYRDYQWKEQEYTNLNEGLIKVFDKGFAVDDYRSIQFGLFDYQTNRNFKIDSFAAKPYDYSNWDKVIPNATVGETYAPNELVLLFIHDAIRNHEINAYSYVYKLVEDFLGEHRFSKVKNTSYGAQRVYQIEFGKKEVPFQVMGTIYVDKDTYAIRKLDYTVYEQEPDSGSPTGYSSKEKDLLYEILVEYQEHNERMYLNYISFHNKFKLVRPPEFFIKEISVDKFKKQLTLILNKPAANWLEMGTSDFKVYYKDRRLKLKKVERVGDVGDEYTISFSKKTKAQRKRLRFLIDEKRDKEKESLAIIVNKMVDAEGNLLAERKTELLDQFREFFTQKIITKGDREFERMSYIDKKVTLGDGKQPKLETKMEEEFWMNTPLKSIP